MYRHIAATPRGDEYLSTISNQCDRYSARGGETDSSIQLAEALRHPTGRFFYESRHFGSRFRHEGRDPPRYPTS